MRLSLVLDSQLIKEDTTQDYVLKSIWVSTMLALMFSLPTLGLFLGLLHLTDNILIASIIAFTSHFILLGLSPKTSEVLLSIID